MLALLMMRTLLDHRCYICLYKIYANVANCCMHTVPYLLEWYRQVRGLNRNAHAFLVGTKYDIFTTLPPEEQQDIDKMRAAARCSALRLGCSVAAAVLSAASHQT
eukprot:2083-Heterococcus_DN1.PRE.2